MDRLDLVLCCNAYVREWKSDIKAWTMNECLILKFKRKKLKIEIPIVEITDVNFMDSVHITVLIARVGNGRQLFAYDHGPRKPGTGFVRRFGFFSI
jgi:hypothetical protein